MTQKTHQFLDVLRQVLINRYNVRVILNTHSPLAVALAPGGSVFEQADHAIPPLTSLCYNPGMKTPSSAICFGIAIAGAVIGNRAALAQPPSLPVIKGPLIAVGDDPRCAVVGDFNGDGKMDFATANQGDGNVSILLAQAGGGFVKANNSPLKVGAAPRCLAVGDFNGDKNLDLAVGNSGANSVSILLGNGTGQFAPAPASPVKVGTRPMSVAVSDFDGNGKADLAVVNNTADNVSVLLGDGAGGFTEAPGSPLSVSKTPFFVTAGDVNSDGAADLVVASSGANCVSVLLGQGGGRFGNKTDFATGTSARSVAIADLDGDTKADLAVVNTGANSVSLLQGKGEGKFAPKVDFPVGKSPRSLVAGDFNKDGKLDLAVTCYGDNKVFVFLGDGTGAFATDAALAVGSEPSWLVRADLNGDANPDLLVVNADSNDVSILLSDGAGHFKARG